MTQTIDPITVEVLGNAFASLVEEMGIALIQASYSTNIKERRDCSTALFDAQGQTLAQADGESDRGRRTAAGSHGPRAAQLPGAA